MGGPGMGGPPGAPPAQCNNFLKLRDDAQKKGMAIQEAGKRHASREEMCGTVTRFFAAEATVIKFLVDNKTACGVPDVAIATSKESHAKTQEFKDRVCAEGPKPKVPTLSEAIGTPNLDTAKNTKTGPGTFDTLTGNPLAR